MLQQLAPPVAMADAPTASIPQLLPSNQKQQTLSVHAPQQQQQQQPLRQSGTGIQGQAALSPLIGSMLPPQQISTAMTCNIQRAGMQRTDMQGRAALTPFLAGSSPHTQHGVVPSYSSMVIGMGSQMQKPIFANHKRPGPQLQPKGPPCCAGCDQCTQGALLAADTLIVSNESACHFEVKCVILG